MARNGRRVALGWAVALAVAAPAAAQQVASVDVQPRSITLAVGEQREVLATAYDERGANVLAVRFTWQSQNPGVVGVEEEPALAGVAYLTGVAAGATQVRVSVGEHSQTVTVEVKAGPAPGVAGPDAATVLQIEPAQVQLLPTEQIRLEPRFLKDDGTAAAPLSLTWRSYNEAVATVTADGQVVGVGAGNTLIEASAATGLARRVMVGVRTAEWAFRDEVVSVPPTESDTIWVQIPGQGNRRLDPRLLNWRSANPNVAVVSPLGVATGVASGTTEIIAEWLGQQRRVTVTVHRPVEFLEISPAQVDTVYVPLGGAVRFQARPLAADETPIPEALVLWTVGDTTVLRFDRATGQARGERVGSTTLSVRTSDLAKTWTVYVVATGLVLDAKRIALSRAERVTLRAFFADAAGNPLSPASALSWSSSEPGVAQVDNQGNVVPVNFGAARIVANTPWGNADTATVFVQGELLVTGTRGGTEDIFALDRHEPGRLNPVIVGPGGQRSPAYSPDGTRLVYVSDEVGNAELYGAEADGSSRRRLTTTVATEGAPTWGPDARIFYESDAGGTVQIWTMNADGSGQRQLTATSLGALQPAISPDGRTVAFAAPVARGGGYDIFLVNADGSNQRNLTVSPENETLPQWVGDTAVAFLRESRAQGQVTRVVMRMTVQQLQAVPLTDPGVPVTDFALSARGDLIATVLSSPGPTGAFVRRVFLIPVTGGGTPVQVSQQTPSEELFAPAFRR